MEAPKLDSSQPNSSTGFEPTLLSAKSPTQPPPKDEHSTIPPASVASASVESATAITPSLPQQDLSSDVLLKNASRSTLEGTQLVPSLGGIPLMAKLGQGGMGAVYYGIHPRLKKEVAVKVLPMALVAHNPDLVKRFHREAEVASKVHSPNLIGVMDINQENGMFYLVMEFVLGVSAGAYLKQLKQAGKSGLSEADALDVCIAATEGLAAAHAQGIIHRDIKPDNIMIPRQRNGETMLFAQSKLADLGLAREDESAASLTQSGVCMGTMGFMSPEQAMDAKRSGKPGDVFSMGATLYALLAGQAPFTGANAMKILLATTQQPHTPLTTMRGDCSAVTSALLDRCLSKEPEQRFVDGSALLQALKICRNASAERAQSAIAELTMLQKVGEVGQRAAGAKEAPAVVYAAKPAAKRWIPIAAAAAVAVIILGIMAARAKNRSNESAVTKSTSAERPVTTVDDKDEPQRLADEAAAQQKLTDQKSQLDAELAAARERDRQRKAAQNQTDSAETRYTKAMEAGRMAYATSRWSEASAAYADALVAKPGDALAMRGVQDSGFAGAMDAGQKAMNASRWTDAQTAFSDALRIYPGNKEAQKQLSNARYSGAMDAGKKAYDAKDWPDAETDFQRALRERPFDPEANRWLADTRREANRDSDRPRRPIRDKKTGDTVRDVKGTIDKILK